MSQARIVSFRPYHLQLIEPQAEQVFCSPLLGRDDGEALMYMGQAWSCVDNDNVYGSAGFLDRGDHALAWAILGRCIGPHMIMVTRAVLRAFKSANWQRIEALVRHDFEAGERWAVALGMIRMKPNHRTGPDGKPYALWMYHG